MTLDQCGSDRLIYTSEQCSIMAGVPNQENREDIQWATGCRAGDWGRKMQYLLYLLQRGPLTLLLTQLSLCRTLTSNMRIMTNTHPPIPPLGLRHGKPGLKMSSIPAMLPIAISLAGLVIISLLILSREKG